MILDRSDLDLSRQIEMLGTYSTESFETKVLNKYLKKKQTVMDIGANIGFYSMLARSVVGPKGRIYSFEASKVNAELVKKTAQENFFENITVVNVAISNIVGTGFLYVSPYYNSEHSLFDYHYSSGKTSSDRISVVLETVDNFFKKNEYESKVDLIKMDIEGSEVNALDGMTQTINDNTNLVLVTEFWPQGIKNSGAEPKEFLERLDSLGFRIHHIDEHQSRLYPVTTSEMLKIAQKRLKNSVEKTKQIQSGGWYTNLLCIK